jgi:hypothetical protein
MDTNSFESATPIKVRLRDLKLTSIDGDLEYTGKVYNDSQFEFTGVAPYVSYRLTCSMTYTLTVKRQVMELQDVYVETGIKPYTSIYRGGVGPTYQFYGGSYRKKELRQVTKIVEMQSICSWSLPLTPEEGDVVLDSHNRALTKPSVPCP